MLLDFHGKNPKIAPDVFIAPDAVIIGDCEIKPGSTILFGVLIRADVNRVTIGPMSNIQDLTVIHGDESEPPVVLGSRVTVGHRAIVHGCTIEDEAMVGMGAIILNRAKIGKNSIVAAGSVVKEEFVVPPGTLVAGIPAQIKRELKPEEIEWLKKVAAGYYRLGEKYRALKADQTPAPSPGPQPSRQPHPESG